MQSYSVEDEKAERDGKPLDTDETVFVVGTRVVPDGDGEWKVTVKRRDAGRTVHVVMALSGDEDLTVITVY